ncbi:ankyrin repeat-containing domain protein [Podospora australis]|uniref:Ankyrin repeat-containing domain protein n=1 Tax=Podospora australis TaxID=1536484 RepID=A0AAN6WKM9_9PEZI|nr:ankyrin repeat-containing domain protein [Podospora australis]
MEHIDTNDGAYRNIITRYNNDAATKSPVNQTTLQTLIALPFRGTSDGSALHIAVRNNDPFMVQALLSKNPDVNCGNCPRLDKPLITAVTVSGPSTPSPAIVAALLKAGAHIDSRDRFGWRALDHVARRGNLVLFDLLVREQASLSIISTGGWTVLHSAACSDSVLLFEKLLALGLSPHVPDNEGFTAIHIALGCPRLRQFILNQRWTTKPYPTLKAETYNWKGIEVHTLLISLPRMIKVRRYDSDQLPLIDLEPQRVLSPLCVSSSAGDLSGTGSLLEAGANIDHHGSKEGSALMIACSYGRLEVVKLLVRKGAAIQYRREGTIYSAVDSARSNPVIVNWLLVGRFTDQTKLNTHLSMRTHLPHPLFDVPVSPLLVYLLQVFGYGPRRNRC